MPQEIERKFLVDTRNPELRAILRAGGMAIRQGYLRDPSSLFVEARDREGSIRIAGGEAKAHRLPIPVADAGVIAGTLCRSEGNSHVLDQGIARIRIAGDEAWLTIKGKTSGISRAEFEYAIPVATTEDLLGACGSVLRKTRYFHPLPGGLTAEVDVFHQIDLTIAEVELSDPEEAIQKPAWFGPEVSDDPAYFNNAIASRLPSE